MRLVREAHTLRVLQTLLSTAGWVVWTRCVAGAIEVNLRGLSELAIGATDGILGGRGGEDGRTGC